MLYLIGLGLGDPQDITVKGLDIVRSVDKVYLEAYTSILCGENSHQALQEFYGRDIVIADREAVETDDNQIINDAKEKNVALLVVGDPFGATTHSDMVLRARKLNIDVKVVHNASIMNAIAACGLQLYNFGETVSIPLWEETWKPHSFFDKILKNKQSGLHTLCLLDIKVKEKSWEALTKGKDVFLPPRFMSVSVAAQQLLEVISSRIEAGDENQLVSASQSCVGVARIGSDTQQIKCCSLSEMAELDLGKPLHSLVIPGVLHPLEEEMLDLFK
ncbi:Diphthine methyl ester synthase [Halotydeus destructor]|nr:Diphthine methyl ester synthase [Halotydeus destructor]